ncbi:MAG: hypothetical protein KBS81_03335 [Spirochaetales bacterium]|nr:hypothetical protein [Candidatus Physcosoma equi]
MDFSNYEIYYKMTPVPDNNVAVGKTTGNFYYHLPETLIVSQGKWQCDIVLILKSQYKQFSDDMKTKISTTPNIWAYEATTTEYINLSNTSLVFKITPTSGDKGFLNINYTANLPTGYNLQTINVSYQKIGSNDLVHSNTPSSSTNNNSQSVFSESRGLDVGKYVAFVNPQLPKKRHSISGSSMNQPAGW